jgi:uroporphyrinogen decarboxylase
MQKMTSKERVKTVLNGKIPDRIPLFEFLLSIKLYKEVIGRIPEYYNAEDIVDCAYKLGIDITPIPMGGFAGVRNDVLKENEYVDEWGIIWRKPQGNTSFGADVPVKFPLRNREDWNNYSFPDINKDKENRLKEIKVGLKKAKEKELSVFGYIRGPFTSTWFLFGFTDFSYLLYEDPELIDEVMKTVTDFYIQGAKMMAEEGVDAILFADDYGATDGPLISPDSFKKHVIPQLNRMITELKVTGIPVVMHSDGNLNKLMPDIVKTGIWGYHPMERNAGMDIKELKKSYGNKITLIGNVNNKTVLVNGSKEEVIAQTRECIEIAAPGGRYILASDHSVHDDIPNENIFTMIETGKKYGKY